MSMHRFSRPSTTCARAAAGLLAGAMLAGAPPPNATTAARADETAFVHREAGATKSITAEDGTTWAAASGYVGVARLAHSGGDIAGTTNDSLYHAQRWGMTGWNVAVPASGEYRVKLHLADAYWTQPNRRVFDVTAEGNMMAEGVDIVAAVGPKAAHVVEFTTTVTDGRLDLGFLKRKDNVTIGAIEVLRLSPAPPVPPPPPDITPPGGTSEIDNQQLGQGTPFVSRMVASPTPVTDKAGNVWGRWSATLGSINLDRGLKDFDIAGTDDDALYRSNVWDARGYSLDVPGPGTYQVRVLMAENTFWHKGGRVFGITAEGAAKVDEVDITAAVGPRAAHEVTFTTEVTDGVLDLEFVKKIDNPLVSAIEVSSVGPIVPAAANPRNHPGLPFPLGPGNAFKQDISTAPLAENGAAVGDYVAREVAARYGGYAGFNAYDFSVGMNVADATTKRVDLVHTCAVSWGVPPNLFDGAGHFTGVPVPEDAKAATGSDGQMTIYDPATDQMWEFWKMQRDPATGQWGACWGGRIDNWSTNESVFPAGFGASASGMAIAPGMVTMAEARAGRIDHALTLALPGPSALGVSWPANRTDGSSTDADAPYEGQRLRLRSDLDLDSYNLTPIGRMIAESAQKYGFIVTDKSGAVSVSAESGLVQESRTGVNPWRQYLGGGGWAAMRHFPWSELEALPIDYGKP